MAPTEFMVRVHSAVTDSAVGPVVVSLQRLPLPSTPIVGQGNVGRMSLRGVVPGRYVVTTRALGFYPRIDTITTSAGQRLTIPLDLMPLDGCDFGVIVNTGR